MENLIKRYFWVANLVVLATIAYLSARVANNVLAGQIAALPTHPSSEPESGAEKLAARASQAGNPQDWANNIIERNLFNAEPVSAEADAGPAEPQLPDHVPDEKDPNCKKSDGRLGLLATMVADPRDWSMAVVNDGESPDNRLVKEGQPVGEYTISAIYRERMVVARGGQYECVDLGQQGQKGAGPSGPATYNAPPPVSSTGPADGADAAKGVTKTGENAYKIDREMLNEKLNNLEELARQARVIPHYRDGKPQGFKLVGVRPGSLYSHIGIRSGDVLKSVNDEEISSPNKALEMYEKLKNSAKVTVEIERRGRPVTLSYDIQ